MNLFCQRKGLQPKSKPEESAVEAKSQAGFNPQPSSLRARRGTRDQSIRAHSQR